MKRLFAVLAFMATFVVSEAMAAGSIDGDNDNSGIRHPKTTPIPLS